MGIPRKLKICKTCGDPSYLWSNGNCQRCAGLIRAKEKPFKPLAQTKDGKAAKVIKIPMVSKSQVERLKVYRVERDKYLDENKVCEFPGCEVSDKLDLHHGKGKVGMLLTDSRYFKALCRPHHNYVEIHPGEAIELGLSFKRLDR